MTEAARPRPDAVAFRKAGPGALVTSWRSIVLLLVALAAYAYGWHVTQIDFPTLLFNLPKAERIVVGLLQPDVIAQETETVAADAPLSIGDGPPTPSTASVAGGTLTVMPGAIGPGDEVTISLSGARPNSELLLALVDGSGNARPIRRGERTDASGAYALTFAMPAAISSGTYAVRAELSWGLGRWQPTEAFVLSLQKMIETIFLALMGTTFALIVSIPLSFLGARNLMQGSRVGWALYYATRTLFNVLRSIETLILAVIMAVVVGLGPFAGVMAIVIHSIGAMGKLYSESIESIDPGPIEAITATGANRFQVVLFGVIPQVVPQFLSFTMYRWDINVRLSTVIGLVGGGGIGFLLIQYINLLQWNQAGAALWLIGITVIVMDQASAIIRARLV
ncbi:MAG: phosphonate ABC transporter, permease protein PhnE [Chloroflexi bacterium]|nr:phosphonate ABC transporter, permease protein PhnE [Chloroflexota bacterium]